MKQIIAQQHARFFMAKHGLEGWTVRFDKATNRLGCCRYSSKVLSFSLRFLLVLDDAKIIDTILHEIAHALVGRGHKHDWYWKQKCREIGANSERVYDGGITVQKKWVAACPKCGEKLQAQRLSKYAKSGKNQWHIGCYTRSTVHAQEGFLTYKRNTEYIR